MSLRTPVIMNQYRGSVLVTGPAIEPVTLSEIKRHMRVDDGAEDQYIFDAIAEARQEIEDQSGLALITQSWRLTLDHWPRQREEWWDGVRQSSITELYGPQSYASLILPRYPLQSITSVTVYDEASNSESVVVADVFDVDTYQRPGRMRLKSGATWPIALRPTNAIEIVYVAGFGAAGSTVPAPIKRAIRNMATYLYEHRGDCGSEDAYYASGADKIIAKYRPAKI